MKGHKYGLDSRVAIEVDKLQAGVVLKCCFIDDVSVKATRWKSAQATYVNAIQKEWSIAPCFKKSCFV